MWRRLVIVCGCFSSCLNKGIKAYVHIDCMWSFEKSNLHYVHAVYMQTAAEGISSEVPLPQFF